MCRVALVWVLVLVASTAAEEVKKEVQKRSGHGLAEPDFKQEHHEVSRLNSESHKLYRHHGEQALNQKTQVQEGGNHIPIGQQGEIVLIGDEHNGKEEDNSQYGATVFLHEPQNRGYQHHELQGVENHIRESHKLHQRTSEQVLENYNLHRHHGVIQDHNNYHNLRENIGGYVSTTEEGNGRYHREQDASKLTRGENFTKYLNSHHKLQGLDQNTQDGGHHILLGHQRFQPSGQGQSEGGHTFHRHHEAKTITVTKEVPVPFPVHVTKEVPYPVRVPVDHPVAVPVVKPYPVKVTRLVPYPVKQLVHKPYPVYVERVVPYPVERVVPLPLKVTVPRPVPYRVPVIRHVPYPVERHLPVPVKVPVEHLVPVPVAQPYPVVVEQRVPYVLEREVPYPVKVPVHIPLGFSEHHHPQVPTNRHILLKVHH